MAPTSAFKSCARALLAGNAERLLCTLPSRRLSKLFRSSSASHRSSSIYSRLPAGFLHVKPSTARGPPRMAYRRSRRRDSNAYSDALYGSDSEPSEVDDVFDQADQADDAGYENSQTDIDDFDPDDFIKDDIDAEDAAELFEGNLHPPEYYVRCIQDFNESAFDNEDYCPGTTVLLNGIEEL